jgi:hypothetical protein
MVLTTGNMFYSLINNKCSIMEVFVLDLVKTMDKNNITDVGLIIRDREECDYILYSLKKLPEITNNVNMQKLHSLIGNLEVLKQSFRK